MKKIISSLLLVSLILISCGDTQKEQKTRLALEKLQIENDSLKTSLQQKQDNEVQNIASFLTFQKEDAEKAMNLYMSLFDNSEIVSIQRWGKDAPGKEGTIMHAAFTLDGRLFMCSDSPPIHNWDFTPAVSNYVECKDEAELEKLFTKLSENGEVTMPLNNYGFSQKFGWVIDQFGVSWQLNLK